MDNQHRSGPDRGQRRPPSTADKGRAAVGTQNRRSTQGNRPRSAGNTLQQSRKRQAPPTERRRRSTNPARRATPDVVYTPAKPFNRNRFLLRLVTVVAVVIAITFGISIFFKVETVVVSGMEKYTAWDVKEASGIQEGDNLLTLNKAKAYGAIKVKLPYVKTVRIGIKLPDTVNIFIEELEVVYAMKADDGTTWLVTSDGKVVEKISASSAVKYTNILGVQLASPEAGQKALAADMIPEGTDEENSVQVITAAHRLQTALTILQYLEANGVIGEAASVDVSDMGALQLWYGQQYRVKLGDASQLSRKINSMKVAIDNMAAYQSGELDVSFTIWPDDVAYTPFQDKR